jgi:hypothetical protein
VHTKRQANRIWHHGRRNRCTYTASTPHEIKEYYNQVTKVTTEFPYWFPIWIGSGSCRMASSHQREQQKQVPGFFVSTITFRWKHALSLVVWIWYYASQRAKIDSGHEVLQGHILRTLQLMTSSGADWASMEVVVVMSIILVVQVEAKTEPCAGFAECSFLRGGNSIFPAPLMDLCCARGISVCLHPQRWSTLVNKDIFFNV